MKVRRRALALLALAAAAAAVTAVAVAGDNESGFHTTTPAMLTGVKAGVMVKPIITVGDTLPGGYMFESIPDGIAFKARGKGRVDLWVNHETSTVPFPVPPTVPIAINDFTNAMVSRLALNQHSAGVLSASYAIPSEANYQRFCSSFLATAEHGFDRELLFTNEEATDWVFRTGVANPGPTLVQAPNTPGTEQAGVVVALDIKSGEYKSIYGMGRHNHENSVAIPGYGHPVVLSGDDTFSAPASQLYLYESASSADLWADKGKLWAFQSLDPAINDYGDLASNGTATPGPSSVNGHFIEVPEAIAKGDQNALESWSNANNVFQFIRVEDIAYDRSNPKIVYFADTGEPRAVRHPTNSRLMRGSSSTRGPWPNGRLFKLQLGASPTGAATLSVLIDADAGGYNNVNVIHQPDNVETTAKSLLIQEDPGGHNQGGTTARIWRYDLQAGGAPEEVAKVNQAQAPAGTALGAWESSGIIDASSVFGPGAFLVDIQAPTLTVARENGPDFNGDGTPEWIYEREGGQLLLVTIPGA
jgi:hypothetical protein